MTAKKNNGSTTTAEPEVALAPRSEHSDLMPTRSEVFQFLGRTLVDAKAFAMAIVGSGFFTNSGRKMTPEEALVVILKGRELGLPPLFSLSHIRIVKGNPTIAAEAMLALVVSKGVRHRWVESTETRATLELVRPGHAPHSDTFTIEDAQRAKLVRPDSGWMTYPKSMLRARCITFACRAYCPDLILGISYTAEELGAEETGEGTDLSRIGSAAPEEPSLADARAAQDRAAEKEAGTEGRPGEDPLMPLKAKLLSVAAELGAVQDAPSEIGSAKDVDEIVLALPEALAKKAKQTTMRIGELTEVQMRSLVTAYERMRPKKEASEPAPAETKKRQAAPVKKSLRQQIVEVGEEKQYVFADAESGDFLLAVDADMSESCDLEVGEYPIDILTDEQKETVLAFLKGTF